MADEKLWISKITLPTGNTYHIKDETARSAIEALSGSTSFLGVSTTELYDGATTSSITVNGTSYTASNGNIAIYGNKEFIYDGTKWCEFGDLSALGDLAYLDTINTTTSKVLGTNTTFQAGSSAVTFTGGATDTVLGASSTFNVTNPTINVTPTTKYVAATATNTAVGADGTASCITGFGTHTTDTFVKSVSAETNKRLVTTSVPNVTTNTSVTANKSTWTFSMGSGTDAETLIIGGGNGSDVTATNTTLGTAITVATGATDANGTGDSIVTGVTVGDSASAITALGTPTTATALTGVKVTTQPTISLALENATATGRVGVMTGASATATGGAVTATGDNVVAVTSIGTGTAAAQTITVTKSEIDAVTTVTAVANS